MSRFQSISEFLERYKYVLVIFVIVLIVGFVDDNSFWNRRKRLMGMEQLRSEVEMYKQHYNQDSKELERLNDAYYVEKVARERYFMKRDNEDVFVVVEPEEILELEHDTIPEQMDEPDTPAQ